MVIKQYIFCAALIGFLLPLKAICNADLTSSWYAEVIQVAANDQPLDTGDSRASIDNLWFEAERIGHAAPEWYDWDRDGLNDLIVGGFSGRARVYRNIGNSLEPRFGSYEWVRAGNDIAMVRNFCCIATGIRMADINGDGTDDLTVGHYAPGLIYWFRSDGDNLMARRVLTNRDGIPILTGLDRIATMEGAVSSFAAKPAWIDWDDDDDLDLVIGDLDGDLVVRYNQGPSSYEGVTDIDDQPVFSMHSEFSSRQFSVFEHIEGGPGPLADERYLSPDTADWDQDGLIDLVIGTQSGAVYWLRNIGASGEPYFAAPEQLLPTVPGNGYPPTLLIQEGEPISRGARASVDAADFNGDGKLDLLVGDWSRTVRARSDLTEKEREEFDKVQQALIELDRRAGIDGPPFPFRDRIRSVSVYRDAGRDSKLFTEMQRLELEALAYLEPVRDEHLHGLFAYTRHYGHVWAYIRK